MPSLSAPSARNRRALRADARGRPATRPLVLVLTLGGAMATAAGELPPAAEAFATTLVARYATHLCEPEYMRCLGVDDAACRAAVAASPPHCPTGDLYEAVVRPHATAAHATDAISAAGVALGHCVTARVEQALALRFDDFPRCFDELAARVAR
ncbi:MAG: hypothetical protein RLW62_04710 [Gammaproteobacteria bacterium]